LRRECLGLAQVLNLDDRAPILVNDLEWPTITILLHGRVIKSSTDKTPRIGARQPIFNFRYYAKAGQGVYGLDVEDGISWVHSSLVLGRFTDQALLVGEGYERWGGETTLLVGDDFDIGALIVGN
jgi:hypothetical protein